MENKEPWEFSFRVEDVKLVHYQDAESGYNYSAYRSGRRTWGLVCVLEGSGVWNFQDGTRKNLLAGTATLLPPTAAYHFVVPSTAEHCLHYTINFTLCAQPLFWPEKDKPITVALPQLGQIQKYLDRSFLAWQEKAPGYRFFVLSELYRILHEIMLTYFKQKNSPADFRRLAPALEYMTGHLFEKIKLETLAQLCGLSVTHFRRLFNDIFSMPPIHYLNNIRLEHTIDLLQVPGYTVAQVAEMCGMADESYFIRFFRERTGITPLQYQKQHGLL